IAQFLKEYWGVQQGKRSDLGHNVGSSRIAETIGESEKTTQRRGQAETDPIKKARIGDFMREYWKSKGEYLEGRPRKSDHNGHTLSEVAETIGETERTTKRLLKLNALIPPLQALVSAGKLGTTAAEQLAYLSEDFTFSERMEWARRLERIEREKARERQHN